MAVAYIISGKCKVLGFSFLKIFCLRYECLDFLSVDGISSMDCLLVPNHLIISVMMHSVCLLSIENGMIATYYMVGINFFRIVSLFSGESLQIIWHDFVFGRKPVLKHSFSIQILYQKYIG
jgi:hypothetical protein